MFVILMGYLYLSTHRPFEVWPALEDMHVERLYFMGMVVAWLVASRKRLLDRTQFAILGLAAAAVFSWVLSPFPQYGEIPIKNYLLATGFAVMLASSLKGERQLRLTVVVWLAVNALYMMHSLWEYAHGKHTFRMGIARLLGVDLSLGDPNSFAGSIVYALPFAHYLWKVAGPSKWRWALVPYAGLSMLCILLTGSRGSLIALMLWGGIAVAASRHRMLGLAAMLVLAPAAFVALPESLQNRFETIINPDVGPKNAKESGLSRIDGLVNGGALWAKYPLSGCGPGAWRKATGSKLESHSLPGQVVGELGTVGLLAFGAVVGTIYAGCWRVARAVPAPPPGRHDPLRALAGAVAVSTFLLLVLGFAAHNLYRVNYALYLALLGGAWDVIQTRKREALLLCEDVPPASEWGDEAVAEAPEEEAAWA